ncbi:MAG: T9SS type A sorting domain-containing protein [Cyclobacteriaceae bacterium]
MIDYEAGTLNGAGNFVVPSGNIMTAGTGYKTEALGEVTFTGEPNTGTITKSVEKTNYPEISDNYEGFNLLANPYTADIGFEEFMTANTYDGTNTSPGALEGTMWFLNDQGSNGSSGYLTVNSLGSVFSNSLKGKTWTGLISSAQGFMVRVADPEYGSYNVKFNNDLIIEDKDIQSDFFRSEDEDVSAIYLTLAAASGVKDMTMLGFKDDASAGNDHNYDASKIDKFDGLKIYSMLGQRPLAIQGLPVSAEPADILLGINSPTANDYTISWDISAFDSNNTIDIKLRDQLTGNMIDMRGSTSYAFTSVGGVEEDRFSIEFGGEITAIDRELATPTLYFDENDQLVLKSDITFGRFDVQLVDLSGRVILEESEVTTRDGKWQSEKSVKKSGLYIVIVQTTNGTFKTRLKLTE